MKILKSNSNNVLLVKIYNLTQRAKILFNKKLRILYY